MLNAIAPAKFCPMGKRRCANNAAKPLLFLVKLETNPKIAE